MKILHLIATASPESGGPIEGILRQNDAMPDTIEVASLDSPNSDFVANFPIKIYPLGTYQIGEGWRRFLKRYGLSYQFLRWLRQNVSNYDCVVVNGLWNFTGLAASLTLPSSQVPYFVYAHGMLDPWFRVNFRAKHVLKQISWLFNEGRLLTNARAVLFTTEDERDLARTTYWGYKYREAVVGYGTADPPPQRDIQEISFRSAIPALGNRRYLLFLSRIHEKKGCDILIRAFAAVADRFPEIDLVIAGPDQSGLKKQLQEEAARAGFVNRIHWPGMITGDIKWGAFRSAEAFILPSHSENFGVVVAEALACSRAVLISNKVNIWRVIESEGAGLVEDDNLEGTVRLIEKFLALPQNDKLRMQSRARECFVEHFEIKKIANELHRLLKHAVEDRAH